MYRGGEPRWEDRSSHPPIRLDMIRLWKGLDDCGVMCDGLMGERRRQKGGTIEVSAKINSAVGKYSSRMRLSARQNDRHPLWIGVTHGDSRSLGPKAKTQM